MKTEPPKETLNSEQTDLRITIEEIQSAAHWIRKAATRRADAGDMAAAALLQEQSDALLAVVDKLKESK